MTTLNNVLLLVGAGIAVIVGLIALIRVYRTYRRADRRSVSSEAILSIIAGVVALVLGGGALVVRPVDSTSVALLGSALAGAMAANAVLYRHTDRATAPRS